MTPIRPENRGRYPKDWKAIRERILERARNRCEECRVPNYATGYRATGDRWVDLAPGETGAIRIVLTIAHLDHVPENCSPKNLRALCQRCHLRHDREHHARSRRENREKDQLKLI